ncbi:hypothetical protein Tco_1184254 [Tanacetum coccineum]
MAMSSVEAEYVAAAGCCANILSMKSQLSDYDIIYTMIPIFYDNTNASKNRGKSLYLDYKIFYQSIGLEYNNGQYDDLPLIEAIKAKLLKLGLRNNKGEAPKTFVNRTPMLKTWFPMMMVFSLLKGTKIDIGKIIYTDLITRLLETPRKKYVAYPSVVNHQASVSPTPLLKKLGKKKKSQTMTKPKTKSQGPEDSIIPPKSDDELKELNNDDIFKAREEMEDDFEESQPPP